MGLFKKKKIEETNEITVRKDSDIVSSEEALETEFGLIIKPCEALDLSNPEKFQVIKDGAAKLSPLIAEIPSQATNAINYQTLSQNLYSVTFNGRAVMPGELYQKSNGSFISNLKNGNTWGKQTDLQLVDTSKVQLANVANAAFGLASVATSTYYLKNIDEKLGEVVENTKAIQEFLETDKQAKIQSDYETLQGIVSTMDIIKSNKDLMTMKLSQVGRIQDEQRANITFYEREITNSLEQYAKAGTNSTKGNTIAQDIKRNYFYYQISMETYSLSKLIEVQLTEEFDLNYLKSIKYEFKHNAQSQISLHDKILNDTYITGINKFSSKAGIIASDVLGTIGESLEGKNIKGLELAKPFNEGSSSIYSSVQSKSLKHAMNILDEKTFRVKGEKSAKSTVNYEIMKPYVDVMESMEATYESPMTLISDGKDLYLQINTEIKEEEA